VTDDDGVGLDHTATFGFDGGARLIDATLGRGAGAYRFRYAYDGLQNMVRRETAGPSALGVLTGQHRYGELVGGAARGPRQLTSIVPDAAAGSAPGATTTTFDYDGAGRTVRQGALVMDYNSFDQLVRVRGAGGAGATVTHAYGHDGLRVRTVDASGAQTRWFSPEISETDDGVRQVDVRVGDRLIARVTRTPAAAASVSVSAAGLVRGAVLLGGGLALLWLLGTRRRRIWRPVTSVVTLSALALAGCATAVTTSAVSEARTTGAVLYYHQAFGAGPALITRADGSVFDERRHEPYGAPIDAHHDGATTAIDYARDPHNVLNKLTDPATGWSDHGARWMAPETGRWLTPDPPVMAPDEKFMVSPWGLHPYQYVQQNPVMFWDPDGRDKHAFDDSPSGELAEGAFGLFLHADAAFGEGMIFAIKPLQSDSVPTALKIPYAIIAPVPMVVFGAASVVKHVGVSTFHIVKGGVRVVGSGIKSAYRAINPAPVPVVMPKLDPPTSREELSVKFSSTAKDDPAPPAPPESRRPTMRRRPAAPPQAESQPVMRPREDTCITDDRVAR
jgi:RHS repeat-associated protein